MTGCVLDLSLIDSSDLTGIQMSFATRPMARESATGVRKGTQLATMQSLVCMMVTSARSIALIIVSDE